MLQVEKLIKEHLDNWRDILQESPYAINISEDIINGTKYYLLKYNQIASDFKNEIVRECRGLILDENFNPVCVPFYKFGNYGEGYCPNIDWSTASVQEKVDGSLIKFWFDKTWHISTNGTIDSFKAPIGENVFNLHSFGEVVLKALDKEGYTYETFTNKLDKDYTYMFELVSPLTRVVIDYKDYKLYFLGLRNNKTLEEHNPEKVDLLQLPKRYPLHSLNEVVSAAESLPWNEEGYVVCDSKYNRVKIKSPSYVMAHYMRNNNTISYSRLLDVVLRNEVEEFLIYADEYKDALLEVKAKYEKFKEMVLNWIVNHPRDSYKTQKEYALEVIKQPKPMQQFLFRPKDAESYMDSLGGEKLIVLLNALDL